MYEGKIFVINERSVFVRLCCGIVIQRDDDDNIPIQQPNGQLKIQHNHNNNTKRLIIKIK